MEAQVSDRYVVVDVETANRSRASICQIGIVLVSGGEIVDEHVTLVDPDQAFDPFNSKLHGIDAGDVRAAPTFPMAFERVEEWFYGHPVLGHSHFDKAAFRAEFTRWNITPRDIHWGDSIPIIRKAFPKIPGGYGLANLTAHFGISFSHHDALEDARATAQIVIKALSQFDAPAWDVMRFEGNV